MVLDESPCPVGIKITMRTRRVDCSLLGLLLHVEASRRIDVSIGIGGGGGHGGVLGMLLHLQVRSSSHPPPPLTSLILYVYTGPFEGTL